jgi:hypothetical protein
MLAFGKLGPDSFCNGFDGRFTGRLNCIKAAGVLPRFA